MSWFKPHNGQKAWGAKNGPPDLEEIFKRFFSQLKKAWMGSNASPSKPTNPGKKPGSNFQQARLFFISFCAMVVLLWGLSGIFIVNPAEQAVILRFGKYVETVGPGPHWIPQFIAKKTVVNVDRVSDYSYSAHMLTRDENLVSVSLVVQYRIGDLEAYFFNVADPIESLHQATSSALRQVVGTTTLDEIITEGREAWGGQVHETLVKTLARYHTGIVIVNVSPQPARAPENVQDAFDDAIKAQEDEKRYKEQAYAYKASVVPIAEGKAKRIEKESRAYAQQVVLHAQGEIASFVALLPFYTQSPAIMAQRMYLETMEQVLSKTTKILIDTKNANVLNLPVSGLGTTVAAISKNQLSASDTASAGLSGEHTTNQALQDRAVNRQMARPDRIMN